MSLPARAAAPAFARRAPGGLWDAAGRRACAALAALVLAGCSESTAPHALPAPPTGTADYRAGQLLTLNVNTASACNAAAASDRRVGRVVALSAHAVVVADTSNPAGGFTDADYARFAVAFDTLVYPVDVRHFGAPADAVSGGRALIFYTGAVNALTPANADYLIGGFFWVRDLFPTTGQGACAGSNAAEMFYMLVPDPSGAINGNVRTTAYVDRTTVGVLGHEFQHLINASRRLYTLKTDNFLEELWLNEGLSHVAEELDFYRAAGLSGASGPGQSPRARLTPAAIGALPNGLAALNGYELSNIGRLSLYLGATEQYGPYVPESSSGASTTYDFLEMRGAIWSFLRYAADRSGKTDSAFFQPLVNNTQVSFANLAGATGLGLPALQDWLRDWAVSNYADGLVPGLDPAYRQASWDFRQLLTGFTLQSGGQLNNGVYPLHTRALADQQAQSLTLRGGTAAYLEFSVPGGATATLRTSGGGAGGAPPGVMRVSLVAVDGAAAGAVTHFDAAHGAQVAVPNAGAAAARYALVLFDADTNYNATQGLTVTGTGLGAPPAVAAALASRAAGGPTVAALGGALGAAAAAEPFVTDAPVLARLHALARRELAPRAASARAALRVQRLAGPPVLGPR